MKKDILLGAVIVLLLVLLFSGTEIQSVDEYYMTHADDITEDSETVTLSIECSSVLDHWEELDEGLKAGDYIPEDGIILPAAEYVLRPGDTVFDLLDRAVRKNKIQMEYQGVDMNIYNAVYVTGINYLYEFSCGPHSGWIFTVNGEVPPYGCDSYELEDGDTVEWSYTCALGEDVGARRAVQGRGTEQ